MRERPHPPSNCPKCGYAWGFLHAKPTYVIVASGQEGPYYKGRKITDGEYLSWPCTLCGWKTVTPTADTAEFYT